MEASEDLVELEADNIKSISSLKENTAVFSRANDAIFNHINIFDLKPDDNDLQISPIEEDKNEANSISTGVAFWATRLLLKVLLGAIFPHLFYLILLFYNYN